MTQAYPLHWPEHWSRTERRKSSQFKTSLSKAMDNVENSLRLFGQDSKKKVDSMVISSNYSLTDRRPENPGVAVYFTWDGIQTCIAVDRYEKIEENLQAIHHCIEAERTKLRHGGINLVRASFRGYAALPPPPAGKPLWYEVLGLQKDADESTIKAAFKEKYQAAQSDDERIKLNQAYQESKG